MRVDAEAFNRSSDYLQGCGDVNLDGDDAENFCESTRPKVHHHCYACILLHINFKLFRGLLYENVTH